MLPASTSAAQDEVSALNRARDLAAQADQGSRKLVFSLCGNVYECMSGLTDSTLNLEPPPRREHPNSRIGFGVNDAAGQRHALLRRQDLWESIHPPQPVYHQPDGGEMQVTMMPGLFAGFQAQHPFQVMYAGGDQWFVGGGSLRVYDFSEESGFKNVTLKNTLVSLQKGWICLSTDWDVPSVNAYTLQKATVTGTSDLNDPPPPAWSINENGNWEVESGTILIPVAYVEVRTAKRPLLQQSLRGDLSFEPTSFPWGLTGPRNLPF